MVREYLKYDLIAEKNPNEDCVWISGDTFKNKELLRKMNGTWISSKKMWRLPEDTDLSSLKLSKAGVLRTKQIEDQKLEDWFDKNLWRFGMYENPY